MSAPDTMQARAVFDLMAFYGWSNVAIIHEATTYGMEPLILG